MPSHFICEYCNSSLVKSHKSRHTKICRGKESNHLPPSTESLPLLGTTYNSQSPPRESLHRGTKDDSLPLLVNSPLLDTKDAILERLASHAITANTQLWSALQEYSCESLSCISSNTRHLWDESKAILPVIIPSAQLWRSREPGYEELFNLFLDSLDKTQTFENHGSAGRRWSAVYQLQFPNPNNPTYIMNAELQLPEGVEMIIPTCTLARQTPGSDKPKLSANLTPMHTVVEPHIDQGREGLIQCIGPSRKLILAWPWTKENSDVMRNAAKFNTTFLRIRDKLQGGLIIDIDSSVGLVLSTGTIHMTITIEGGMLVGINWQIAEAWELGTSCFQYELDVGLDPLHAILSIWADQLELSLILPDEAIRCKIFRAWVDTYPSLYKRIQESRHRKNSGDSTRKKIEDASLRTSIQKVEDIFRGFFRSSSLRYSCCGCDDSDFKNHFQQSHMDFKMEGQTDIGIERPKKRKHPG